MLATGGSAAKAIEVLEEKGRLFICSSLMMQTNLVNASFYLHLVNVAFLGVAEEKIIFVNLVAAPEGVAAIFSKFPNIKIVSAA